MPRNDSSGHSVVVDRSRFRERVAVTDSRSHSPSNRREPPHLNSIEADRSFDGDLVEVNGLDHQLPNCHMHSHLMYSSNSSVSLELCLE